MMMPLKTVTGRDIAALLNPRLAVLVTCCDLENKPNILTVAWHTPLAHRPPMLGISIGHTRYSHALIKERGEFAVNIVGQSLLEAVKICGMYTGEIDDKLDITHLGIRQAAHIHPPVLEDAVGVLECQVVDQVEAGDHTFFVGQVLLAQAREDCFSNVWSDAAVLQCLQRDQYGTFLGINGNGRAPF
ncbi:MAG: flavin reductase family protein [Anaerolineales bacterium]|nr:flavin reductase family protein [Anaerolineales bacterium]